MSVLIGQRATSCLAKPRLQGGGSSIQSEATTRGGEIADLELERSLLATLLADNGGSDKIGGPQPDDLFDPIYASVLAAGLDLRRAPTRQPHNAAQPIRPCSIPEWRQCARPLEDLRVRRIDT